MGKEGWYLSVLVLFSILLLAPAVGMQSAFADGNGSPEECDDTGLKLSVPDEDEDPNGQTGDKVSTILTGEVVTGICIKSGNDSFTGDESGDDPGETCNGGGCKDQHSIKFTEDGFYGNDGCYEVTGLGTIEVTIEKTRDDNTCKDLSHVDVMSGECVFDETCDDSDVCNGAETCDATNGCQAGTPLVCDDDNVCTANSCDLVTGCAYTDVPDGTIPDGSGSCDTGLLGVCAEGFDVCDAGGLTCQQSTQASDEICGDGLDNDCDGVIDNGCNVPPTEICEELKTIDFEGLCSSIIDAPISIDGNDVTLQVGVDLGTAEDGYAVTVGNPREAFVSTVDDTPFESSGNPYVDAGSCFYSDDINGFDAGFNYYLSFTNPLDSLSLDLYDYSDDGNLFPGGCIGNSACDGDVATLTVYSDLAQNVPVGIATYTVDANNWTDGQSATLTVGVPTGPIISASLTFSDVDRGTGIDNITFCETATAPPAVLCDDLQIIDFENTVDADVCTFDSSPGLDGWISIGDTSVLLQVGTDEYTTIHGDHPKSPPTGTNVNSVPLGPGITVTVGSPDESFAAKFNEIRIADQPANNPEDNICFFSDDSTFADQRELPLSKVDPFRGDSNSFYYLTFADPITSLSLDLYDYADDTVYGGALFDACDGETAACNSGAIATLTAFENDDFTNPVAFAEYVVDDVTEPFVDGQIANLSIPTTPGVSFLSASLTLSAPDIGTGIDNIAFCGDTTAPPADLCENVVCDDNDVCNGVETCNELGICEDGTPLSCDDNNVCNGSETCDAANGCEVGTPLSCDDGEVCNGAETCDTTNGCNEPLVCQPEPVECIDCSKPTEFTVSYDGPDGLTFDIVKLDKNGNVKEIKFDGGIVNDGESITIDSTDFNKPKETVEANSAYLFSNGDLVEIHTSCSKPLYEGLEVTSGDITLTVESGLVTHVKGAEKGTFDELDMPIDAIPPTLACYDDWKANK